MGDEIQNREYSRFYNDDTRVLFHTLPLHNILRQMQFQTYNLKGFPNNKSTNSYIHENPEEYHNNIFDRIPNKDPKDTRVTRKIRFFPTAEQQELLSKCFGTTRFLYNRMLEKMKTSYDNDQREFDQLREDGCIQGVYRKRECMINGKKKSMIVVEQCGKDLETKYFCHEHANCKVTYSNPLSFQHWRKEIIVSNKDLPEDMKWLAEIPYDTRQLRSE